MLARYFAQRLRRTNRAGRLALPRSLAHHLSRLLVYHMASLLVHHLTYYALTNGGEPFAMVTEHFEQPKVAVGRHNLPFDELKRKIFGQLSVGVQEKHSPMHQPLQLHLNCLLQHYLPNFHGSVVVQSHLGLFQPLIHHAIHLE